MPDAHGQPNPAFHFKRNIEKALTTLWGILNGMAADGRLTEPEVIALDTWLRDNKHLHSDPDVVDLLDASGDILSDGIISTEEQQDLLELIYTVLEYRHEPPMGFDEAVDQLIGLAHGLVADRILNDKEIQFLKRWLRDTEEVCDAWPGSVIHNRVRSVLADGSISPDERDHLLSSLDQLVGSPAEFGVAGGMATTLPITPLSELVIADHTFCLTGKFLFGPRKRCEAAILDRGGKISGSVSKKVSVLVIGALASRDWMHTSHGRKIEKAIALHDEGNHISIVSEEFWSRLLT